jgi:hypothetical protein
MNPHDLPAESPDARSMARPAIAGRLAAAARQLVDFCRRQRLWLMAMTTFVAVWTIELYWVQATTLVYPNETGERFAFWAPKIRLALDLLFLGSMTFWLRRRWLIGIVVASFFVYLGLITYYQYFHRPLSILTLLSNRREGIQVGGFALDLFPRSAALILALALAAKLAALYASRGASLPRPAAWLAGAVLAVGYVSLYAVANRLDPLEAVQTTRGVGRLGAIRGYLGPWFAEWYYLSGSEVLERAIERRNAPYNRLTPVEADIPVHKRLVILQAESLDFNILGYRIGGVEVTPFLNQLRNESMFYRVQAMHSNGSSDADFVALNGVAGSRHQNTYLIPGYPYRDTTPQLLDACGFSSASFHGNTGEFYSRRLAFEKIGLSEIYFREEMEGRYGLPVDRWGVPDRDVLRLSAQKLRSAEAPTCHFVITLTTHAPYNLLSPSDMEIFKNPRSSFERYVNNMRYLDNCLRDYITSLGRGVTIMLYADHPCTESGDRFEPDREVATAREFIPCFIYDTDSDLSRLQETRKQPIATNGNLNLVDMINYLRAQLKRNYLPAQAEGSTP